MKNADCTKCKNYHFTSIILGFPTYDCKLKKPKCKYYNDDGIIKLFCKNFIKKVKK